MRSKLAEQCREDVVEICKKMTPAERLQAFVNLSKAMAQLYWSGEAARSERRASLQETEPTGTS
jgi:hypothetical protein